MKMRGENAPSKDSGGPRGGAPPDPNSLGAWGFDPCRIANPRDGSTRAEMLITTYDSYHADVGTLVVSDSYHDVCERDTPLVQEHPDVNRQCSDDDRTVNVS